MSVSSARRRLVRATMAVGLMLVPLTAATAQSGDVVVAVGPTGPGAITAPALPVRRGAALPPPALPPDLPSGAPAVQPFTVRLNVSSKAAGGPAVRMRQTVSRTADRIHIAIGNGTEWLFEQNPVDRRRVSGYAVLHGSKTIVAYSDSELRNMLGITGWTQVLTLGCELPAAAADGVARAVGDLAFTRQADGAAGRGNWWNRAQLLPAECVSGDGRSHLVVDGVTAGIDAALLTLPAQRFPAYREMPLADWLEAH